MKNLAVAIIRRSLSIIFIISLYISESFGQTNFSKTPEDAVFVKNDIDRFWKAFDLIETEKNPFVKYLEVGSVGLKDFVPYRRIQTTICDHNESFTSHRRANTSESKICLKKMTIEDFPIIKTERLLLRQFGERDLEKVFEGLSDPDIVKYYGVSYNSLEETKEQMKFFFFISPNPADIRLSQSVLIFGYSL